MRLASLLPVALTIALVACSGTEPASESAAADVPATSGPHSMTGYGTTPHVRALAASVTEGEASVSVTVTLSPRTARQVHVDYLTEDGTARDGSDYQRAKGRVTFKPGSTEQAIDIAISDDAVAEADESFVLRLHVAEYAQLDNDSVLITIRDDD